MALFKTKKFWGIFTTVLVIIVIVYDYNNPTIFFSKEEVSNVSDTAELDSVAPVHTTLSDLTGKRVVLPLNAGGNIKFIFESDKNLYQVEFSPPEDSQIPIYAMQELKAYYGTEKGSKGTILTEGGVLESMGVKIKTSEKPKEPEKKVPEAQTPKEYFKVGLSRNEKYRDVKLFQRYLNETGFTIAESGEGSPGNETINFRGMTSDALARYKSKRSIEISRFGSFDSSGDNLDEATRKQINEEIYLNEQLKRRLGF